MGSKIQILTYVSVCVYVKGVYVVYLCGWVVVVYVWGVCALCGGGGEGELGGGGRRVSR